MHKKYVECQKFSAGLYITGRKRKEKKEEERKKGKKRYSCDFGIGFFNLEMLTTILNLHRSIDY